ncbi:uncharacterized protein LOC143255267 [Tachypleus tridentatus]|uniref:uncharacterized protein LOC143255267 n=1 Tax=Tachypleus tridentatus TaxID=6853 RepID=UPI003FD0FDAE
MLGIFVDCNVVVFHTEYSSSVDLCASSLLVSGTLTSVATTTSALTSTSTYIVYICYGTDCHPYWWDYALLLIIFILAVVIKICLKVWRTRKKERQSLSDIAVEQQESLSSEVSNEEIDDQDMSKFEVQPHHSSSLQLPLNERLSLLEEKTPFLSTPFELSQLGENTPFFSTSLEPSQLEEKTSLLSASLESSDSDINLLDEINFIEIYRFQDKDISEDETDKNDNYVLSVKEKEVSSTTAIEKTSHYYVSPDSQWISSNIKSKELGQDITGTQDESTMSVNHLSKIPLDISHHDVVSKVLNWKGVDQQSTETKIHDDIFLDTTQRRVKQSSEIPARISTNDPILSNLSLKGVDRHFQIPPEIISIHKTLDQTFNFHEKNVLHNVISSDLNQNGVEQSMLPDLEPIDLNQGKIDKSSQLLIATTLHDVTSKVETQFDKTPKLPLQSISYDVLSRKYTTERLDEVDNNSKLSSDIKLHDSSSKDKSEVNQVPKHSSQFISRGIISKESIPGSTAQEVDKHSQLSAQVKLHDSSSKDKSEVSLDPKHPSQFISYGIFSKESIHSDTAQHSEWNSQLSTQVKLCDSSSRDKSEVSKVPKLSSHFIAHGITSKESIPSSTAQDIDTHTKLSDQVKFHDSSKYKSEVSQESKHSSHYISLDAVSKESVPSATTQDTDRHSQFSSKLKLHDSFSKGESEVSLVPRRSLQSKSYDTIYKESIPNATAENVDKHSQLSVQVKLHDSSSEDKSEVHKHSSHFIAHRITSKESIRSCTTQDVDTHATPSDQVKFYDIEYKNEVSPEPKSSSHFISHGVIFKESICRVTAQSINNYSELSDQVKLYGSFSKDKAKVSEAPKLSSQFISHGITSKESIPSSIVQNVNTHAKISDQIKFVDSSKYKSEDGPESKSSSHFIPHTIISKESISSVTAQDDSIKYSSHYEFCHTSKPPAQTISPIYMYEDLRRERIHQPSMPPTAGTSFDIIFGDPNWRGVDQLIKEWEMILKRKKEEAWLMQQKIPSKKAYPEKYPNYEPEAKPYQSRNDYVFVPCIHSMESSKAHETEWPCVHKDQINRNTQYFKHLVASSIYPTQSLGKNYADTLSTFPISDYNLQSLPPSRFHYCCTLHDLLSSNKVRESLSKNLVLSRRTDVNLRSVSQQPIDILDEIT